MRRKTINDLRWIEKQVDDKSLSMFKRIAEISKTKDANPTDLQIRQAVQDYLSSADSDISTYGFWLSSKGEKHIIKNVRKFI